MRRNRPSDAPGLRAKLARGSAGFGAGPNKLFYTDEVRVKYATVDTVALLAV